MQALFIAHDGRLRATWRFVMALFAIFFTEVAGGIAAYVAARRDAELAFLLGPFFGLPLLVALFLLFSAWLDHVSAHRAAYIGFSRSVPWVRELADGTLLGAGMVTVCVVVIAVLGDISFVVALSWPRLAAGLGLLLVILAAAAIEEVETRGYAFQRLEEAAGPWVAVVVTSGLFGFAHFWNPASSGFSVANTVLIGAFLALAYVRTRALWLPIGIHFGWNFMLGSVFGLPVSGLDLLASVVRGRAAGPPWLTGGGYGIEASALATVVVVLSVPVLLTITPRRPAPYPVRGRRTKESPFVDAGSSSSIQPQ